MNNVTGRKKWWQYAVGWSMKCVLVWVSGLVDRSLYTGGKRGLGVATSSGCVLVLHCFRKYDWREEVNVKGYCLWGTWAGFWLSLLMTSRCKCLKDCNDTECAHGTRESNWKCLQLLLVGPENRWYWRFHSRHSPLNGDKAFARSQEYTSRCCCS
jgi:hypothetical protein